MSSECESTKKKNKNISKNANKVPVFGKDLKVAPMSPVCNSHKLRFWRPSNSCAFLWKDEKTNVKQNEEYGWARHWFCAWTGSHWVLIVCKTTRLQSKRRHRCGPTCAKCSACAKCSEWVGCPNSRALISRAHRPMLLKVDLHTFFSRFQIQSNEKFGSAIASEGRCMIGHFKPVAYGPRAL